jgi:hypothetical protein
MSKRNCRMPHALNLVLRIKQDQSTQALLQTLKSKFSDEIQPHLDKVLRDSKIMHFARIFVIDDKYIVLVAEYDGDYNEYSEFFRVALPQVFKVLFSLAEGAPPWEGLDPQSFFELTAGCQRRSLGISTDGLTDQSGEVEGYLFSAYGSRTVTDILRSL